MIRIFEDKAAKIVASYLEEHENLAQDLKDCLVEVPNSSEYPYLTILLLYRAGLHQEAVMYCKNSQLEDVRVFGDEIYHKCLTFYSWRLP